MVILWGDENKAAEPKPKMDWPYPPKLTVETVDNHVYFYSDVDEDRCLALIRTVRELDSRLLNENASRMLKGYPLTPIWLHVQSPGGALFSGFAVADQLRKIESPIFSIVEGYAASAATIITCACTKRYILPHAFLLIHQLSSMYWGKYEQIKDEMKLLDMAQAALVEFYVKTTKMEEATVRELLKRESWFSAQECVEKGLVDEIWGA